MLNILLDYALPYTLRQGFSLEIQNSEIQLVQSVFSLREITGRPPHPPVIYKDTRVPNSLGSHV